MQGLRSEETRAAQILREVLGGEVTPRDLAGAPDRTHDFDIVTSICVIAVEVTRSVDGSSLAVARHRQSADWAFPRLSGSWHLSHRPWRLEVKLLQGEIEELLGVLERHGVEEFGDGVSPPLDGDVRAAIERLARLGVRRGSLIGDTGDEAVVTFGSSTVGSTSPEVVNRAIESAAKENAGKLRGATNADERHLFLWADSTSDQLNASMSFDHLPVRPPDLPDGIDAAWIAPGPYVEDGRRLAGRLWMVRREQPWLDIGPVLRALSDAGAE